MRKVPRRYWGGVQFGPGDGPDPDVWALGCIRDTYAAMQESGLGGPGNWPWDGINIHVHGDFDGHPERLDPVLAAVNDIRNSKGDTGELLVGEWGFQNSWDTGLPDALSDAYGRFIDDQSRVDVMFFHAHHEIDDQYIAPPSPPDPDQLVPPDWELPAWGIRYYTIAPGAYGRAQKTPLFAPYDELMGT